MLGEAISTAITESFVDQQVSNCMVKNNGCGGHGRVRRCYFAQPPGRASGGPPIAAAAS